MRIRLFLSLLLSVLLLSGCGYNQIQINDEQVNASWSEVLNQYKRRADLIPNLVQVVQGYAAHEKEVLTRVTEARARVAAAREAHDVGALGAAEGMLRAGLGQIFAVAEAYPELKANEHFMQLQSRITALENAIADRREWYNEAVNVLNVRIEQFPDLLIARLFAFVGQPLLQFSSAEKADVDLKTLFNT